MNEDEAPAQDEESGLKMYSRGEVHLPDLSEQDVDLLTLKEEAGLSQTQLAYVAK